MKSPYNTIEEQTFSRIELADMWFENGFYFFAESTILQAYDAVERFEKRLDGVKERNSETGSSWFDKYIVHIDLTDTFSKKLREDIENAVGVMELEIELGMY